MLALKLWTLTDRPFDRQDLKLLCLKYPDVAQMPYGEVVEKYLNFPYRLADKVESGLLGSDGQFTPGTVPIGTEVFTIWPHKKPSDTEEIPPKDVNW